ncbi:hypothetical protein [Pseudopedobacter beijingensis]|uniref:50S ribosomal protein L29 n=1 Tax=Pseudopedobacter beijingensis TaxID=1207056 RepID=A0ABW4IGQ5_9SPHI
MDYIISILEQEKNRINRRIYDENLMQKNMKAVTAELSKITEIKKAIKILKQRSKTKDFE